MRAIAARDAGLALVSRINRWLIAGAIALSGVFSAFAAHAFRGHSASLGATAPARAPAPSATSSDEGGGGLQQPAQSPSPAPASSAPVVSGGS